MPRDGGVVQPARARTGGAVLRHVGGYRRRGSLPEQNLAFNFLEVQIGMIEAQPRHQEAMMPDVRMDVLMMRMGTLEAFIRRMLSGIIPI